MTTIKGKCSWFGGPDDTGVTSSEDLAFWEDWGDVEADGVEGLFLPSQPSGTTGLARRLNPDTFYIACRWDYDVVPKGDVPFLRVMVHASRTGKTCIGVPPADWGPNENTGRVADLSPGLMEALGITTDDEVEITIETKDTSTMPYSSVVISSGHGKYVRGASGIIDEVDEARLVVNALADALRARGVFVSVFHDDTSRDQSTNLSTIVNAHNKEDRELDISVHFNAYEQVSKPMGVEVLYITQSALAGEVSAAIASCGFINRGPKKRSDLYFLNNTEEPAILIETCFVDSEEDCRIYGEKFDEIIEAIATVLGGEAEGEQPPTGERPERPERPPPETTPIPTISIEVAGEVVIYVNGEQVSTKGTLSSMP
jgi:N-acetylmuramoyl-L-alanine amidase